MIDDDDDDDDHDDSGDDDDDADDDDDDDDDDGDGDGDDDDDDDDDGDREIDGDKPFAPWRLLNTVCQSCECQLADLTRVTGGRALQIDIDRSSTKKLCKTSTQFNPLEVSFRSHFYKLVLTNQTL
eukprot:1263207-Amphidinium_carterae.1